MPTYLYGIVPAGSAAPAEPGVLGEHVTLMPVTDALAFLRSDVDDGHVAPRRAHLTAHDRVLAAAMASGPVLPLRFGVVTELDRVALAAELDEPSIRDRMVLLDGRVEVQLLWDLDEAVALERVVATAPHVQDPALSDIDRGRIAAEAMGALAVTDLSRIALRLGTRIVTRGEVEERGPRSARVALLVEGDEVDDLMAACEQLTTEVAMAGTLRTVAPLPPYSFADLEVPMDLAEV